MATRIFYLGLMLISIGARAALVEDHSEFTGTYDLVDGNVKNCSTTLTLEGQPKALVINGFTFNVTTQKAEDVPVGKRMQLNEFVSNAEFVSNFVDNIDVPDTLVQIKDSYQLLGDGQLRLERTNDHPGPHFSAPAHAACLYQLHPGY